ncbi:MAG: hypothetical protein J5642_08380 [Bacteroidales bacterium]|nr:hypothetical protein [Bacteroidales bacterium]
MAAVLERAVILILTGRILTMVVMCLTFRLTLHAEAHHLMMVMVRQGAAHQHEQHTPCHEYAR